MHRRRLIGALGAGLVAVTGLAARARGRDDGKEDRGLARIPLVPRKMFLTGGVGVADRQIRASDLALFEAKIGNYNRIRASSIVPPGCRLVLAEEGVKELALGQILFAILADADVNEPHRRVGAGIGLASPEDGGTGTVAEVFEQDSFGKSAEEAGRKAQEMALDMLAFRWGARDIDAREEYRPDREVYTIGGRRARVHHISRVGEGDEQGRYTNVLAALVFIL